MDPIQARVEEVCTVAAALALVGAAVIAGLDSLAARFREWTANRGEDGQ